MSVTEVLTALGSWQIELAPDTPRDKLDAVVEFGHVAIIPGRVDVRTYGDNLLAAARYTGVVRSNTRADDGRTRAPGDKVQVGGPGMAFWLGDEDDKGSVFETPVTLTAATFPATITALLPASGAVTVGTLYSTAGSYSGSHQWETPRKALNYACDYFGTANNPVSWRINNAGTIDAGPEASLYVTTPQCAIVRRGAGQDMSLLALPGQLNSASDGEDFTTRVVLLAEGDGASTATSAADISPALNPYKDIHGNTVKLTRMVSESGTSQVNASNRAQLALRQFTSLRRSLTLSTSEFDVEGSFSPGDWVWAYDPDKGLIDTAQEIIFRGQRLNPLKLQVTETTWPVTAGHTVAYRAADGTWTDLTDYIVWESGATSVTVGNFQRQLVASGTEPVGSRPTADTSIPGVPTLVEPFSGAAYQDSRGFTRSRVIVTWTAPNNTDSSTILDGDHYEIRYAIDTDLIYPATWAQVSQIRWSDMQTWAQPFAAPDGDWLTVVVGWDQGSVQLLDLSPGVGYDVQIRAVDKAGNVGAWSGTTTFVATSDNIPPSTPAAPAVAGSRIAVQVTHTLGKATGGTYNLESDLHHLEVHVDYEPWFTPSATTLKGKVSSTAGMMQAQIPVVSTVQVEETSARYVRVVAVDIAGNKSAPSDAGTSTALLIDDAHISDLTVSKVTAGTISADWVVGARIKTADTGARVELNSDGLQAYNSAGDQTVDIASATGDVSIIGDLATGASGSNRIVVGSNFGNPQIRLYTSTSGSEYASITSRIAGPYPGILLSAKDSDLAANLVSIEEFGFSIGSGDLSGPVLLGGTTDLIAGFIDIVGSNSAYLACYTSGLLKLTGRFPNFVSAATDDALFTGEVAISGVTGITITYGPTMDSILVPIVTLGDAGAMKSTQVTARSASSFTAGFSAAATGSINFWCFRV